MIRERRRRPSLGAGIGLVMAVQVTSNVDTDTTLPRIAGDAPP